MVRLLLPLNRPVRSFSTLVCVLVLYCILLQYFSIVDISHLWKLHFFPLLTCTSTYFVCRCVQMWLCKVPICLRACLSRAVLCPRPRGQHPLYQQIPTWRFIHCCGFATLHDSCSFRRSVHSVLQGEVYTVNTAASVLQFLS